MVKELVLMKNYPRTNRDIKQRRKEKTNKDRKIAREFEKVFFDEVNFDSDYYWFMP
tara:strand:- start:259 stop:426 length:168 start_codon:yes stop_codon:yes gene_type:complete